MYKRQVWSRYRAANGNRLKWELKYGARFIGAYTYQPFLDFYEQNNNFFFVREYERCPHQCYPAIFENFVFEIEDRVPHIKENTMEVFFQIAEM